MATKMISSAPQSRNAGDPGNRLLQNLKDYTGRSSLLFWQRQAIFFGTTVLTAFYFTLANSVMFYLVILVCEFQDYMIARRVARLKNDQKHLIKASLLWVLVNTLLSATAISAYAISVAAQQNTGEYFTPLFFLFAAALFAAMNNHQIVLAIGLRLGIYGATFLFIVLKDIWKDVPPISSDLWLQFFTVIFVMYFLIDCSIVFLKLYRKNLAQLDTLKMEHERTKAAYVIKSQFVSTVSHELRTPLTSIKGSIDLINSGALGPVPREMERMLEMAGKNGERLSRLIDDVLDLQKIESGEMRFRHEPIDVQETVMEAVSANQGLAEKHNVKVEMVSCDVELLWIMADEHRLVQVISNMISNAAKFSSNGGQVRVGCSSHGGRVRIYVEDEGIGIPQGSKNTVFDRFSQIDSSDERHFGGSGLGMNISKEIVESFGGTIDYESELGTGTTFFVEFPACDHGGIQTGFELMNSSAA